MRIFSARRSRAQEGPLDPERCSRPRGALPAKTVDYGALHLPKRGAGAKRGRASISCDFGPRASSLRHQRIDLVMHGDVEHTVTNMNKELFIMKLHTFLVG